MNGDKDIVELLISKVADVNKIVLCYTTLHTGINVKYIKFFLILINIINKILSYLDWQKRYC